MQGDVIHRQGTGFAIRLAAAPTEVTRVAVAETEEGQPEVEWAELQAAPDPGGLLLMMDDDNVLAHVKGWAAAGYYLKVTHAGGDLVVPLADIDCPDPSWARDHTEDMDA